MSQKGCQKLVLLCAIAVLQADNCLKACTQPAAGARSQLMQSEPKTSKDDICFFTCFFLSDFPKIPKSYSLYCERHDQPSRHLVHFHQNIFSPKLAADLFLEAVRNWPTRNWIYKPGLHSAKMISFKNQSYFNFNQLQIALTSFANRWQLDFEYTSTHPLQFATYNSVQAGWWIYQVVTNATNHHVVRHVVKGTPRVDQWSYKQLI